MQDTITLSQSLLRQGGPLRDEICDDRSPGLVGRGLTTQSPIYSFDLNVKECDRSHIVTKYYEPMNKHLLVINGKQWQYIGYICEKKKYSVYN